MPPTSMATGAVVLRDLLILQGVLERMNAVRDARMRALWESIIREKLMIFSASSGISILDLVKNMSAAMKAIAASLIVTPVV